MELLAGYIPVFSRARWPPLAWPTKQPLILAPIFTASSTMDDAHMMIVGPVSMLLAVVGGYFSFFSNNFINISFEPN